MTPRVFVVNYRFVFAGDVFTDGLRHAAADLGLEYEGAYWDDAKLFSKINRFAPDLMFVVHGRRFAQRLAAERYTGHPFGAVWLVDEPYETDDTQRWSGCFDTVFINDPATLRRHRNAHYLPMCFDPHVHRDDGAERIYQTGFVGNWSPLRERYLSALADAGLLGYVVGERWRASVLSKYCMDGNVLSQRTAELYQKTAIVINIFRAQHHYNAQRIPATAMNPRIYEALACGAAVVSERREGIAEAFAALPQFGTPTELVEIVRELLAGDSLARPNLVGHAYRDRLSTVIQTCLASEREAA